MILGSKGLRFRQSLIGFLFHCYSLEDRLCWAGQATFKRFKAKGQGHTVMKCDADVGMHVDTIAFVF